MPYKKSLRKSQLLHHADVGSDTPGRSGTWRCSRFEVGAHPQPVGNGRLLLLSCCFVTVLITHDCKVIVRRIDRTLPPRLIT